MADEQIKPSQAYIDDQLERWARGEEPAIPPGQDVMERRLVGPSEPQDREEMGGPRSRFLYQGEPPREPGFSVEPPATPPEPPESKFADRRTWAKMLLGIGAGGGNANAMRMLEQMREEEGMVDLGAAITQSRTLWEAGERPQALARFDKMLQSPQVRMNPKLYLAAVQHRVQMGQEMVRLDRLKDGLARLSVGDSPEKVWATMVGAGADMETLKTFAEFAKLSQGNFEVKVIGDTGWAALLNKRTGDVKPINIAGTGNLLRKYDSKEHQLAAFHSPKGPDGMPLYPNMTALAAAADARLPGAVEAFNKVATDYNKGTFAEKRESESLSPVAYDVWRKSVSPKYPYEQMDPRLTDQQSREAIGRKEYITLLTPGDVDGVRRASTAGQILNELEQIVKSDTFMFPREKEAALRKGAKVTFGKLAAYFGGAGYSKTLARLAALNGMLTMMSRALGEGARVSDPDRQFMIEGLGTTPAVREVTLERIESYRRLFLDVYRGYKIEPPPGLDKGQKTDWRKLPPPPGMFD